MGDSGGAGVKGWCGTAANLGRLALETLIKPQRIFQSPGATVLSQAEEEWAAQLGMDSGEDSLLIFKYLCWRRSKIQWAVIPFLVGSFVFKLLDAIDAIDKLEKDKNDPEWPGAAKPIIEAINIKEQIIASTGVAQEVAYFIGAALTFCTWTRFSLSLKCSVGSFIFAFFLPFFVFFLPWTQISRLDELTPALCDKFMAMPGWETIGISMERRCCFESPNFLNDQFHTCVGIKPGGFIDQTLHTVRLVQPAEEATIRSTILQGFQLGGSFIGMMLFATPPVMYIGLVLSALVKLGPGILGLQGGTITGSANIVCMIPESRMAMIIMVLAVFIGMPCYLVTACAPLALIGTVICMFGAFLFASGNLTMLFRFPELFRTVDQKERAAMMTRRKRAGLAGKALGGLLFGASIFLADHLKGYAEDLHVEKFIKAKMIVSFVLRFKAVNLLSQVATSDMVLYAVHACAKGHNMDSDERRASFDGKTRSIAMLLEGRAPPAEPGKPSGEPGGADARAEV